MADNVGSTLEQLMLAAEATAIGIKPYPAWRSDSAAGIPAVGRALSLYSGLLSQMPLQAFSGVAAMETRQARLLDRPQPDRSRAWFVSNHVTDYLLHGNAVHEVVLRYDNGWPKACVWLPASRVTIDDSDGRPYYGYLKDDGTTRDLDRENVVHVQRGARAGDPWVGVGVVEQHLNSLSRVYGQEAYESSNLRNAAVPSVAVIAPNPRLDDSEIKQAQGQWQELYGGYGRVPGIFPGGTEIRTLAFSPSDQQLTQARQLGFTDVANMFNLDSYWLGAPGSSHTYRSPGPLFTTLMRTSLEPVIVAIEQEWQDKWLPRGQELRFLRRAVEADTLAVAVETVSKAVTTTDAAGNPLMTIDEGRAMLGLAVTEFSVVPPTVGTATQ